ncbi:ubiquitin carboxyl-terminal hydrolase 45-like [Octodon degus]|uniref:ubiquitinyl hydrolase 1 n=1 Tax=Octodon degus TaxID=10160 RepID=A0A6P6DPH4_OCTDE|nr:ubiquitin carboxyl-terminal hydrolase 45-like [Octodon degus]
MTCIFSKAIRFFSLLTLTHLQSHNKKPVRRLSCGEENTVSPSSASPGPSGPRLSGRSPAQLLESPSDGSERAASPAESSASADADSEASEWEAGGRGEELATAVSQLCVSGAALGDGDLDRESHPTGVPNNRSEDKDSGSQSRQHAFQTLSHGYITTSKECSVQSCLYQFTSMELLMGNNKLLCETCTEKKHKCHKDAGSAEKKAEGVYTNARKQLLISAVPAILILHLKRFHQAGMSLRKVNRHVDFPLTLDLAPFCSAACKNVSVGDEVLYDLYGIVEHSGSMRGGHYTAYVKVRQPSRTLLEHITGKKSIPGLKEPDSESEGQWVHISDTYVQVVPESRALCAQAYLLFYERIL